MRWLRDRRARRDDLLLIVLRSQSHWTVRDLQRLLGGTYAGLLVRLARLEQGGGGRMIRKLGPNDAHLWAVMTGTLRAADVDRPDVLARSLVADVRRERAPKTRTFAPGDVVPYDVTQGTDLDGDVWERIGEAPNERDMWRMPGFDPDRHEPGLQGCQVTPFLLESYGPITEMKR